jgi:hypothetical protein
MQTVRLALTASRQRCDDADDHDDALALARIEQKSPSAAATVKVVDFM